MIDKRNNANWLYIGLVIVIVLLIGYIVYDKYSVYKEQKKFEELSVAYNAGVSDSIIGLLGATDDCQISTLNHINRTRGLVDIECANRVIEQLQAES